MGGVRYEELQDILEQREAELANIKQERCDKDAAISFLKTKIVSLQNQTKVHADTNPQANNEPTPRPGSDVRDQELQDALQDRDRRIIELEAQIGDFRQETERSQRAVHRFSSGGMLWELEEARRRLAERDSEVERLRRSLDWQERETKRISESSAADLEELKQLFFLRDREVADLKAALAEQESNRREQHLEVELRRQTEQCRRLTALEHRGVEEAENLRRQLSEARDEVSWLWRSLREQSQKQEGDLVTTEPDAPQQAVSAPVVGVSVAVPVQRLRSQGPFSAGTLSLASAENGAPQHGASPVVPIHRIRSPGLVRPGSPPLAGAEAAAGDEPDDIRVRNLVNALPTGATGSSPRVDYRRSPARDELDDVHVRNLVAASSTDATASSLPSDYRRSPARDEADDIRVRNLANALPTDATASGPPVDYRRSPARDEPDDIRVRNLVAASPTDATAGSLPADYHRSPARDEADDIRVRNLVNALPTDAMASSPPVDYRRSPARDEPDDIRVRNLVATSPSDATASSPPVDSQPVSARDTLPEVLLTASPPLACQPGTKAPESTLLTQMLSGVTSLFNSSRDAPSQKVVELSQDRAGPGPRMLQEEKCQAADAGAGTPRRSDGEDKKVEVLLEIAEICTAEDRKCEEDLQSAPATHRSKEENAATEEPDASVAEVTGGGALLSINFFDDDLDVAAKAAKKERVARQIERRRQARGAVRMSSGGGPPRTEPGETSEPGETASFLESPRFPAEASNGAGASAVPELHLPLPLSSQARVRCMSNSPRTDDGRIQNNSPSLGSPIASSRFELPRGSLSPLPLRPDTPTNGGGSDTCGGKTPTLHSKFAGLRDEMKRRRSKPGGADQASDPLEMAEAVIAEANLNPPPSSRSVDLDQASSATPVVSVTAPPSTSPVPAVSTAAVAVAVSSAAAASAAASRVLVTAGVAGGSGTQPFSFSGGAGTPTAPGMSPRSARLGSNGMLLGRSPGECVITTTSSATAPPGAPAVDRLTSSGGTGGRIRGQAPSLLSSLPAHSAKAQASPFYIPLGGATAISSSASAPGGPPSAPMSPHGGTAHDVFARGDRSDPLGGSLQSLRPPPAVRNPPQRMRSVPQEHSVARLSSGGDLERSRRAAVALSARSVHGAVTPGGASSRFSSTGSNVEPSTGRGRGGGNESEQQDALHDAVVRFCMQRPTGRYPLVRLSRGVYLYGNKKLVVAVHNDKLMVRIGGGFVHLESHLLDCDRAAPAASSGAMSPGVPHSASTFEPAARLSGVGNGRSVLAGRR